MFKEQQQNFNSIGNDLLISIAQCEERIRISKQNEIKYNEAKKQKESADTLCDMVRTTANHMNKVYKNVKYFLENKKTTSKDILESAIHNVSEIVQDSDLTTCKIIHDNGKTKILNIKGQNINEREGSAARAVMGLLLKYTCIKAMPNKIQLMLLDEAAATLSSSTSVNFREVIDLLSNDIGIVGIEQKDILYSGLSKKKYVAEKLDKVSTIREEAI
jgi:ABC-type branched-subunit amino acid transport system ATPase component